MTFTSTLLETHNDEFHTSVSHPLAAEWCLGTLSNRRLWTYVNQDLLFFTTSLPVLGQAMRLCDSPELVIVLGKQIGFLANDENDYFYDILNELKKQGVVGPDKLVLPEVQEYLDYLQEILRSNSYAEVITFLWIMEKVYLEWPKLNPRGANLSYRFQKWLDLHEGPDFERWVDFLDKEVNRVALDNKQICQQTFTRAVKLETNFFAACYDYKW